MKQEQIRMEFMKEYEQREEDRISLLQYKNLRSQFQNNLVRPILGERYYNMGMCVYSCDRFTVEDLAQEYYNLQSSNKFFKIVATTSIVANVILITLLMLTF